MDAPLNNGRVDDGTSQSYTIWDLSSQTPVAHITCRPGDQPIAFGTELNK